MITLQILVFIVVFYLSCVYHFTPKEGTFSSANLCINCDAQLTHTEIYRSPNGTCPHCGYRDPHAVTLVQEYQRGFKWGPRQYLPWKSRKITWTEDAETAKQNWKRQHGRV